MVADRLGGKRLLFPGSPHAVQRIGDPFDVDLEKFLSAAEAARQPHLAGVKGGMPAAKQ
ncbi:MAG: hypothetical protein JWN19_2094 [Arthrobacter sp.]|nr:hypothetical protein [Arthrobacter sp.]